MRIVYVNDALAIWGGMERVLVEKINELTQYGHEMFLITTNQGEHIIPFPLSTQVVHYDLDIRLHLQYRYRGFRRLLKKIKLNRLFKKRLRNIIQQICPDVIVCTRIEFMATIVKIKGKVPLIFESHSSCHAQRFLHKGLLARIKLMLENRTVRFAQHVVALTEGDANEWRSINSNVSVIPNIVHLNPKTHLCDYSAKSAMFVGRFHAQKDILSLLKIWRIVYDRHPDWTLHLYGGYGEEEDKLLPIIHRMNGIFIHEPTNEIFERYLESSIFLLTSLFEPFGLVIAEAMSCGLPVVAFDCPYGPADIILDGKDGFLIKNRDIEEYAEKVCSLIENPELRKKMGSLGANASQRYKPSLIMPLWDDLFKRIIAL